MAGLDLNNLFRGSLRNNCPAIDPASGSKINDPVGAFDDFQVMLDHDQSVSLVAQLHQDLEQ